MEVPKKTEVKKTPEPRKRTRKLFLSKADIAERRAAHNIKVALSRGGI